MRKPCLFMDCDRLSRARGLCMPHYMHEKDAGRLYDYPTRVPSIITCGHPDRQHYGKGRCRQCYDTIREREDPNGNSGGRWLRAHPVEARLHRRRASLKKYYGITLEEYADMWQAQGGKCANARCSYTAAVLVPDFRRDGLQVDHDHVTGARRGLLCRPCNQALGHARDEMTRLTGLIEYLNADVLN